MRRNSPNLLKHDPVQTLGMGEFIAIAPSENKLLRFY